MNKELIEPITPRDAESSFPEDSSIPSEMVFVINEILKERYVRGRKVDITLEDIRERWDKLENAPKLLNAYLNFEPLFEKKGWSCRWIKESNAWEGGYDRYEFSPKGV